jgi:predicted nucleic acid-binding protein
MPVHYAPALGCGETVRHLELIMKTGSGRAGNTMRRKLLDTNILVDALRGLPACEDYLSKLEASELLISTITLAELWAGARDHEEDELDIFLSIFRPVPVSEAIAKKAGHYMKILAKSHGLGMPDALIAASAHAMDAEMVTLNTKHFPMTDLRIVTPY